MSLSTLTSKGQTTIPKEIRDHLKIKTGEKINFIIRGNEVLLSPANLHIHDLKGILKKKSGPAISIEEMNLAIKNRFKNKQ